MVVRKNISLENSHLKKLEQLTKKHNGNLSAAIRDAIDVTEVALRRYGTIEKAVTDIAADRRELTARERSIETGRNVLLSSPIFIWMIRHTSGILLDKEILDELLDPLKIKMVSELDKQINEIGNESGLNCKISIFSMDNINPSSATVTVTGDNEHYRDFLAQLVVMFLVYNKDLDIDIVHKRASMVRIDLRLRKEGTQQSTAKRHFGYLKDVMQEIKEKQDFWKNLVEIYTSLDYNIVSLSRDHYEELLSGSKTNDTGVFESLSKRHISSIPHAEFLKLLKKTQESLQVIDNIEIFDRNINIYHRYKNEKAIQKVRDYYLSLLRANGHEYEAKYSSSLIVLSHVCCIG